MQNLIKNLALWLFLILLGAASDHFVTTGKVKSIETELSDYKNKYQKATMELSSIKEKSETETGKEVVKRRTETKPDGSQIVSEDIVRDYLIEKKLKEAVVLQEQVTSFEKENSVLRQKIEEFKKPEYAITLFPSYSFSRKDFVYTFAAQKRVFWDCYLGISLDIERVGIPLTCNF